MAEDISDLNIIEYTEVQNQLLQKTQPVRIIYNIIKDIFQWKSWELTLWMGVVGSIFIFFPKYVLLFGLTLIYLKFQNIINKMFEYIDRN